MRVCKYCLLELVPGVGSESEHWRSKSGDGKLRYFCSISPDALHHLRGEHVPGMVQSEETPCYRSSMGFMVHGPGCIHEP